MEEHYIGIDVGGTKVRVVLANNSELLIKYSQPTVKTGPESSLVSQVIKMIYFVLKQAQLSKKEVFGIGISSAGPFVDGTKIFCPNISGVQENNWGPLPFIEPLKQEFGYDIPIILANDCVSSVQAEHLFGAGQGYSNLVYITISTGVGSGIIIDNHLCQGKGHNAGHFGHMVVKKEGPLCGCGNNGCIETLISGKALARIAKEKNLIHQDSSHITSKDLFEAYRNKNPVAVSIISEMIEYCGLFFSNVINVTDCEIIIIGGSVFYYNSDVLMAPIKEYIKNNSYRAIAEGVKFKLVGLGEYIGDIAGLSLVLPENCVKKWQSEKPWEKGFQQLYD